MAYSFGAGSKWTAPKTLGTVPGAPQYKDPVTGKSLANTSAFWAANPYQQQTQGFQDTTGAYVKNLMNQVDQNSPFAGGGGFTGAMERSGAGYADPIHNPRAAETLQGHISNLRGNEGAATADMARAVAQAGNANSSGGFVAGGVNPQSAAVKQAMDSVARMSGQNYGQGMDYLYKDASIYGDRANALTNYLASIANTGAGMNKQVLDAIGLDQAGLADWEKSAGAAYGADVNANNAAIMGETARVRANRQAAQAESARNATQMQSTNDQSLLKELLSNPILPESQPALAQLLEQMRVKGLYNFRETPKASGAPIQNYELASGGQGQISGSGAGGTVNTWKPIPWS